MEQWLFKLMSEKKTSWTSFHREVKKWILLLQDKVSKKRLVSMQTTQLGKTSTLKQNLKFLLLDVVKQKLFDSETPPGRPAEIPRRPMNLGYDNIKLANPDPANKH